MQVDTDRLEGLMREKEDAQRDIERLGASDAAAGALQALHDRIRAIDEELDRMEFAAEVERQSDA
jgi:hypothetical protein